MVTVHYLGGKIKKYKATMEDIMFHLGAKFGALKYNMAIKNGLIRVHIKEKRYVINPDIFKLEIINK